MKEVIGQLSGVVQFTQCARAKNTKLLELKYAFTLIANPVGVIKTVPRFLQI